MEEGGMEGEEEGGRGRGKWRERRREGEGGGGNGGRGGARKRQVGFEMVTIILSPQFCPPAEASRCYTPSTVCGQTSLA